VASHVDDGDPLRLRPPWFLNQPAQIIRVTGQQHDRALSFESTSGSKAWSGLADAATVSLNYLIPLPLSAFSVFFSVFGP
jgi:hypothetical protein